MNRQRGALLIASARAAGFDAKIIDTLAEAIPDEEVVQRKADGTAGHMFCRIRSECKCRHDYERRCPPCIGLQSRRHRNTNRIHRIARAALPEETLRQEPAIDYVFLNEGIYAMREMLAMDNIDVSDIESVNGFAVRIDDSMRFLPGHQRLFHKPNLTK